MPKETVMTPKAVFEFQLKHPNLTYKLMNSSSHATGYDLQVITPDGNGRSIRIEDRSALERLRNFCDEAMGWL